MQHSILAAVLALTLAGTPALAEVYKWVDAEGNVHYGDRPPSSGEQSHSLELPPAPDRDSDHGARSRQQQRLLEAFEAERTERELAEAEAAEAKRERAHECDQARRTLANFERANIVYTTDESGARSYMSDGERREAAANARAWITRHCD